MSLDDVLERVEELVTDLTDDLRSKDPAHRKTYGPEFTPMGLDYYVREAEAIKGDLETVMNEQRQRAAIATTRAELAR